VPTLGYFSTRTATWNIGVARKGVTAMTIDHESKATTSGEPELWTVFGNGEEPAVPPIDAVEVATPPLDREPAAAVAGPAAVAEATRESDGVGNQPAPFLYKQPQQPERVGLLGTTRRRWVAGGIAAAAVVGIAVPTAFVVEAGQAIKKVVAVAETPEAQASSAPPEGGAPLTISSGVNNPGNFNLSQHVPGMNEFSFSWGGDANNQAAVQRIIAPNHALPEMPDHYFTETETAIGYLDQYALLLGADPTSDIYKRVLSDFTDSDVVVKFVQEQNATLRKLYGSDFQVEFFDTSTVPAEAAENGFVTYDAKGNQLPSIKVPSSGQISMRVLSTKCHINYTKNVCTDNPADQLALREDPGAYAPGDGITILTTFVYKVTGPPEGPLQAKVEGITFQTDDPYQFPLAGASANLQDVN
jgi:hypothetical protein